MQLVSNAERLEVVPAPPPAERTSPARSASAADVSPSYGLTSEESRKRLEKFGRNVLPKTTLHPLRMAIEKFWAPVPWMLEAAIVLELALGNYVEAAASRFDLES
jgi:H+-transporting ATPase